MSEVKIYAANVYAGGEVIARGADVVLYSAHLKELAELREELTKYRNLNDSLMARNLELTAAEQRNADLENELAESRNREARLQDMVTVAERQSEADSASGHDQAYRNGLMQGYNFALNGSEKEYQDAVARYSKPTESGAS